MLGKKIQDIFRYLKNEKNLNERNSAKPLADLKESMLEAGVSYSVTMSIVNNIKNKAVSSNSEIMRGVTAEQQLTHLIYDQLIESFGGKLERSLDVKNKDTFIFYGLQGHGKTTSIGKIIHYIKVRNPGFKIMVVSADTSRPAGDTQLKIVSEQSGGDYYHSGKSTPIEIVQDAKNIFDKSDYNLLIVDTAGRQEIDDRLMEEIKLVDSILCSKHKMLVISSLIGQASKSIVDNFSAKLVITSIFVTMMDSSSRLGSILSMGVENNKKIIFEGIGEKPEDIQEFNVESAADRIIDRGDIINLVKMVKERISQDEKEEIEKKIMKGKITFNNVLQVIGMINRLGPIAKVAGMMGLNLPDNSSESIKKITAVIKSMTPRERAFNDVLCFSRKKRIAKGSGTSIERVNHLIKSIEAVNSLSKFMKGGPSMMGGNPKNVLNMLNSLKGFASLRK